MNVEIIDRRISELQSAMNALGVEHERMLQQYQLMVTKNQNRFAQMKGAVAELTALKAQLEGNSGNGETPERLDLKKLFRQEEPTKEET